ARDEDERDGGVLPPHAGEDVHAVPLRQVEVGDHEIELLPVEHFLALAGGVDHEHLGLDAAAAEVLADELDVRGVVFDVEEAHLEGRGRGGCGRTGGGRGRLRTWIGGQNSHCATGFRPLELRSPIPVAPGRRRLLLPTSSTYYFVRLSWKSASRKRLRQSSLPPGGCPFPGDPAGISPGSMKLFINSGFALEPGDLLAE